jgi:hypothetical protein
MQTTAPWCAIILVATLISPSGTQGQGLPSYSICRKSLSNWAKSANGLHLEYEMVIPHMEGRALPENFRERFSLNVDSTGNNLEERFFGHDSESPKMYVRIDAGRKRTFRVQPVPYMLAEIERFILSANLESEVENGQLSRAGLVVGRPNGRTPIYELSDVFPTHIAWDGGSGLVRLDFSTATDGTYAVWLDSNQGLRVAKVCRAVRTGDLRNREKPYTQDMVVVWHLLEWTNVEGHDILSHWRQTVAVNEREQPYNVFESSLVRATPAKPISEKLIVSDYEIPNGARVNIHGKDAHIYFEYHDGDIVKVIDETATKATGQLKYVPAGHVPDAAIQPQRSWSIGYWGALTIATIFAVAASFVLWWKRTRC